MSRLGNRLRSIARDEGGVMGILLALALVPMIGMVGAATDYGMALRAKSNLQAAADAGALAAARHYLDNAPADPRNKSAVAAAKASANERGKAVFESNVSSDIRAPAAKFDTGVEGLKVKSTATFSGATSTYLTRIFGFKQIKLSGAATATLTMPGYRNIYLAVDTSQSMGIAATESEMAMLHADTQKYGVGCVFGCHAVASNEKGKVPKSNKEIAHEHTPEPIRLRIDVVRTTTQRLFEEARSLPLARNVKFAIHRLGTDQADEIAPLSFDYWKSLPASAANEIDIGPIGVWSNLKDSLKDLTDRIPRSGDGASEARPQNIVILMTDGVNDVYDPRAWADHGVTAFDERWCDDLKKKGVTVGVLYTTYLPIEGDGRYRNLVEPIISDVRPGLEACASPGWFFEATHAPQIEKKMLELFKKSLGGGLELTK